MRSANIEMTEETTRGGVDVPFVVKIEGITFGITVDEEPHASEKSLKSLGKFRKKVKNSQTIAIHCGKTAYLSSTGIWCLPIEWLV